MKSAREPSAPKEILPIISVHITRELALTFALTLTAEKAFFVLLTSQFTIAFTPGRNLSNAGFLDVEKDGTKRALSSST